MQQSFLDKWVDIKPIKKKVPKIFYLDWSENRPYPKKQATFYEEKLPNNINYNYEYRINWKDYKTVLHIYGNINKYCDNYNFNIVENPLIINEIFLQSQLQKAIRRKDVNIAVQTANDLIKIDIKKFIRRLPIIMLEDSILHKSFSTIIWLMINLDNEKFKISKNMVKWLLGIVELVNNFDNKYVIYKNVDEINILDYRDDLLKIDEIYYSNLYAILLRKSYGGMKGDMTFLSNCFIFYLKKINEKKLHNDFNNKSKSIELTIKNINEDEYLDYAYDFHVTSKVVDNICRKYPDNDYIYIKNLIWNYSSSINYRNIINNEDLIEEDIGDKKDWLKIKNFYLWNAKNNIKSLIIN